MDNLPLNAFLESFVGRFGVGVIYGVATVVALKAISAVVRWYRGRNK